MIQNKLIPIISAPTNLQYELRGLMTENNSVYKTTWKKTEIKTNIMKNIFTLFFPCFSFLLICHSRRHVLLNKLFIQLNIIQLNVQAATLTVWNVSKYGDFSGSYLPTFGLNTGRYEVILRIQSECGKTRTRKNSVFGHFSRSDLERKINIPWVTYSEV